MDYKNIFIISVGVALCLVAKISCCEKEEIVTCRRENMTCLRSLCSCSNTAPSPVYTYFSHVTCSGLTELPKDIPREVYYLYVTGNNITTIRRGDFSNMPKLDRLHLNGNKISTIEPGGFVNLSSGIYLTLADNKLSRLTANMFRDISILRLYLEGNPITVIETHAFVNLPLLNVLSGVTPFLKKIETEAFVNVFGSLFMNLTGNNATDIQKNAFVNVHFSQLKLGANSLMKESRLNTSSSIYFTGVVTQCDCNLMWLVYLQHDNQFKVESDSRCAKTNKKVSDLVPEDFQCIDDVSTVRSCNESQPVDLLCEYNYLTTNLIRWIHSRNGKFIREVNTDFVDENTNTLHFPFCNRDDSGEYICMLSTDYSLLPNINRSLNLFVNGPPFVLNQHTEDNGDDLILSVMFYSIPSDFNIQWLLGNNTLNGDPEYSITENSIPVVLKQYNVDVTTDGFISNLTIHNFKRHPSDVYSCQISNSYGLVVEKFGLGQDNILPVQSCNASQSVDLLCEYNYLTTYLIRWIHSRNGNFIRELNKNFVDESTNTLHFSFCNHDDSGQYTCMLSTDNSLLPSINISVHLLVNGPPIVMNQHTEDDGDDLILSVVLYSIPYDFKIQWLLGNNSLNGDPQYTIDVNNMTVGLQQYNVDVTTEGFISNLTIHNFKRRPSDVYNCQISNPYGLIVEQIILGPASLELERRTYCDTSHSIELKCTLKLVGATPVPWTHSNAGETIRSLEGKHINNSNILTIPFCNSQDTGVYTCRWKTDILGQTLMEKSTTLSVSGPPFVISQSTTIDGSDTIFSVTFFSIPFPSDPKWYYNNEPVALGTKFLKTTTYSIVQIRQHRVLINEEGFISNLTVHKAEYGLYECVIMNSFGEMNQLFLIEQEQNTFSISTTEATKSLDSTGNSVTVIIAICSSVFGIAIMVICIILFIRRISAHKSDRYNSTMPTRDEDSTYDTIRMSSTSKRPGDQPDYLEVF